MELFIRTLEAATWQNAVMTLVGAALIYLAVKKEFEPNLLLPMGFGTILVNLPLSSALDQLAGGKLVEGALSMFFRLGIATEIFPLLILVAVGAMCDFTPLLANPKMFVFGITAQAGIFLTMGLALFFGYNVFEAASIGIIGAADGPTSIYVSSRFAPHLLGPISVAAYTYMALVPLIQPPVIMALTTQKERRIKMPYAERPVSRRMLILFPIAITIIGGVIAPASVSLLGFVMFGNLLRVSGVTDRLSNAAQNELANIVTILLGFSISATMTGEKFVNVDTLVIIAMGLIAFVLDTAGGVLTAKLLNLFLPKERRVNPMVGAAGISAFPMSARTIQRMGQKADPANHLLMHAVGANVAGQIGSVLAGGALLAFLG
ncbi:sodium ion-translocating decarboxylase subunit beta [Synergistes jonesii]|uniref:Glutaconyl-CoA decarboxylase subunit beta n=1 Tax=Synergistes jonesii TaxID=2754 RepID=A0A073IVT1_9BACT|nr:sodium ion-translocating decarboxylase subunit beta [Synergistes jonesii]KEJ93531.1 glutaconyl-CoA decarboxylase subunit beta [Synergistes jonesii]OFB61408.1 glutaconyl-CoA decarboxylase subunit beta [Synergistes jonesii]OFB65314.1 glutaconyl-CoA decarboxylase subunit beta [Synergistes jonesii]OFB68664.1 glutaconyl-CoA decarboxylase subunit beta [Synergistes jonesii]OFB69330.1 glutaconyl-CoA decarboxylase subunit beta [Synergistes jonesii]